MLLLGAGKSRDLTDADLATTIGNRHQRNVYEFDYCLSPINCSPARVGLRETDRLPQRGIVGRGRRIPRSSTTAICPSATPALGLAAPQSCRSVTGSRNLTAQE